MNDFIQTLRSKVIVSDYDRRHGVSVSVAWDGGEKTIVALSVLEAVDIVRKKHGVHPHSARVLRQTVGRRSC